MTLSKFFFKNINKSNNTKYHQKYEELFPIGYMMILIVSIILDALRVIKERWKISIPMTENCANNHHSNCIDFKSAISHIWYLKLVI